jgi:hypothetical protein
MADAGHQHVIIDPEGDYGSYERAVVLGDAHRAPTVEEVVDALKNPDTNVVANLFGLSLELRPAFFAALVPALRQLKARRGRPHWLIVDEAHHLLPGSEPSPRLEAKDLHGLILVTVHPEHVAKSVVGALDVVMAIGKTPGETLREFALAGSSAAPAGDFASLPAGEAVVWVRSKREAPRRVRTARPKVERQRHVRKYVEGDLGAEKSFYFRGPRNELNLRAQNLYVFLQMGEGVDAATWLHHLRRGDYSRWIRASIQDEALAGEIADVETSAKHDVAVDESRDVVRKLVQARYTAPSAPSDRL